MKYIIAVIILTAVIFGVSYTPKTKQAAKSQVNISANLIESQTTTPTTMPKVTIQTTKGDIEIELFSNDAPKATENFLTLAKKNFYDGVIFHRVIKGFMIQGGDPTGTGRGGPGYTFPDELNPATDSYKAGYVRGTVAMANAGPNTNGSQFFIMHADYPLPHNYTIFGRVTKGLEVVDMIANSVTNAEDRPQQDIVMTKVVAQ
jgi:cyclophilin family peptidyl-prolyl cis-trans isomerase